MTVMDPLSFYLQFPSVSEMGSAPLNGNTPTYDQLVEENRQLKEKYVIFFYHIYAD